MATSACDVINDPAQPVLIENVLYPSETTAYSPGKHSSISLNVCVNPSLTML